MNRIRKGDEVVVMVGRDKGKRGAVLKCEKGGRLFVDGVGLRKKAVRPNPQTGAVGGFVDKMMSIHASNVALVGAAGIAGRVRFEVLDGVKRRVFKSTNEVVGA